MLNENSRSSSSLRLFTLAIIGIVAVLAACNWYLHPDAAWKCIRAMLNLPVLWVCMALFKRWALRNWVPQTDNEAVLRYSEAGDRFFMTLIILMGFIHVASLGLNLAETLELMNSPELHGRIMGSVAGAVFILIGNTLPKILTPQALLPDGGALRVASARRFVGWTWVLLGIAMVLSFLFIPFEPAKHVAGWMAAAGVLVIPAAIIWMNFGPRRRQI